MSLTSTRDSHEDLAHVSILLTIDYMCTHFNCEVGGLRIVLMIAPAIIYQRYILYLQSSTIEESRAIA